MLVNACKILYFTEEMKSGSSILSLEYGFQYKVAYGMHPISLQ